MKSYLNILNTKRFNLCILCKLECLNSSIICEKCELSFLKTPTNSCDICLAKATTKKCGKCIIKKPFFDKTISVYQYDKFTRFLIKEMKFNSNKGVAIFFAKKIATLIDNKDFDLIIPTPIHYLRWINRGYNPVLLMSYIISKKTAIPLAANLLIKKKYTKPLSISNKRNAKIIQRSFTLKKPLKGNILLIDDIITTGTTANSIAKILKANYATTVTVATAIKVYINTENSSYRK